MLGASLKLRNGVGPERMNTTKSAKAIRKFRYLTRSPAAFSANLGVLVCDRSLVRIAILIRERQHDRSSNSCCIEKEKQIAGSQWFGKRPQFGRPRAEQMLMVVHRWL